MGAGGGITPMSMVPKCCVSLGLLYRPIACEVPTLG